MRRRRWWEFWKPRRWRQLPAASYFAPTEADKRRWSELLREGRSYGPTLVWGETALEERGHVLPL